jgi:cation diffusion facilitator family transporter
MPALSTEKGASTLLIVVVIGLIVLKIIAGLISGSISVFAQLTDSLLDLFAGVLSFVAVRIAIRPADEEHPFGHGKVEDIAGMVQGILIFAAAGMIVYASVLRIIHKTGLQLAEAGIGVMVVSMIASLGLSRYLLRVSKITGSIVLEANARNIQGDIYSAAAVLVGLLLVRVTGVAVLDPLIAIAVAVYLVKLAYETARKPFLGLVDASLPRAEQAVIESCLAVYGNQVVGFHELRTRRSGSQRYIDLHLVMSKDVSLEYAHQMCDLLEQDIKSKLPRSNITIHIEPCDGNCKKCVLDSSVCKAD